MSVNAHATRVESSDEERQTVSRLPLAKIKQLFSPRADEFYIELDEPHRVYGPGDLVRGRVYLLLVKDTKTLHTSLRFRGQVRLGSGKTFMTTALFQQDILLHGKPLPTQANASTSKLQASSVSIVASEDGSAPSIQTRDSIASSTAQTSEARPLRFEQSIMKAGRHVFEFEFSLPLQSLPSSLDFGRGSISYTIRCEHQRRSAIRSRGRCFCRKDITVLEQIDIARLPTPKARHIDPDQNSKHREGLRRVKATIQLARGGFLKGETITLNVDVQHVQPIKNMHGTIATLYRLSRFDSHEVAPQSFRKDLAQSVLPLLVDPATLGYNVSVRLRIPPDAFPTTKAAGPVSFRYFVEVLLDLNGRSTVWQSGAVPSMVDSSSQSGIESGSRVFETDAIKREKGVHCVVFEIVIGTKQSSTPLARQSERFDANMDSRTRRSVVASVRSTSMHDSVSVSGPQEFHTDVYPHSPQEYAISDRMDNSVESGDPYPLSKSALQAIEASLLPSLPPSDPCDEQHYSIDPVVPQLHALDGTMSNSGIWTVSQASQSPTLPSQAEPVSHLFSVDTLRHQGTSPGINSAGYSLDFEPSAPPLEGESGTLPYYRNDRSV